MHVLDPPPKGTYAPFGSAARASGPVTHFDAPVHWISGRDGPDISQIPPRQLIGPAAVIDKSAECAKDPDFLLSIDGTTMEQALAAGFEGCPAN